MTDRHRICFYVQRVDFGDVFRFRHDERLRLKVTDLVIQVGVQFFQLRERHHIGLGRLAELAVPRPVHGNRVRYVRYRSLVTAARRLVTDDGSREKHGQGDDDGLFRMRFDPAGNLI